MSGYSGEIGRTFIIEDRASAILERIAERLTMVDEVATRTEAALRALSSVEFQGTIAGAGRLYESLDRLNTFDPAAITSRIESMTTAVTDVGAAAELLPDAFENAAARINAVFDEMISRAMTLREVMGSMGMQGEGPTMFSLSANASASAGAAAMASSESTSVSMALAEADALALAEARATGAGGGGRRGAGGGGRGGRRGGHGGLGGLTDFLFQPETLIEGYLGYDAIKQSATADMAVQNSMMFMGINSRNAPGGENMYQDLQGGLAADVKGTKFTQSEAAKALEVFSQVISSGIEGSPQQREKSEMALFPVLLRTAEAAQQQGLGSLNENMAALSIVPHLAGVYDPAKMEPIDDVMLKSAEAAHASLTQTESIFKYSMPVGKMVGMDPLETAQLTGFLMRQVGPTSTAGTGLARVMLGDLLATATEPGGHAHSASERHKLYDSLHLEPEVRKQYEDSIHAKGRGAAARELGLVDEHGKNPTIVSGHMNFEKLIEILTTKQATMDPQKFAQDLEKVFLVWGSRALEQFIGPENVKQRSLYGDYEGKLPGGSAQLAAMSERPLQEFQQALARSEDILKELADPILPGLGKAAESAAKGLESVGKWMEGHKEVTSNIASAGAGALAGAAAGAAAGAVFGGVGAVPGALIGAGIGAGTGIFLNNQSPAIPTDPNFDPVNPNPFGNLIQPQAYHPTGGGNVHIENISVHGSNAGDLADQLMAEIAKRLGSSQTTNLGAGGGVHHSPFTSGATVSI